MMFRCRFIAFIFLLAIAPLGCDILNKGEKMLVRKLDAVILTANDLPTMQVDVSTADRRGGMAKQPPVVDGFSHSWNGTQPEERFNIKYWLFQSVADARKAANHWQGFLASGGIYLPEPNAADVIGDATWRIPNNASIWFVKNNVLVYVRKGNPFVDQLPLTRSVARKIETKINA
ncbi:MAG: hypothetical protein OXI63_25445, partial [Candidatus Poribacteria bacterium]|nr:hypothetical protein [Candidatus Poribacteria bacterium]